MPANNETTLPLIAGAGPVGLAAALFLARGGVPTRIIERRDRPSTQSRALAVNPRTMEILESTGVTAKMLELGLPIHGAQLWKNGKPLAQVLFSEVLRHKYPFMLALSQATTERLLEETLREAGGVVERSVEMLNCCNQDGQVVVELRAASEEHSQHYKCPWLLGADGAHSTARGALGLGFEGSTLPREWHLADIPLATSLAEDRAHVFFFDEGGFVFCLRVIEDKNKKSQGGPIWRLIGSMPNPLKRLETAVAAGPAVWTSRFRIEHRIAERLQDGRVFLAGDAAHIHSPMGARGMNLGIEDAWSFSRGVLGGDMISYGSSRRKIDIRVVNQIERLTNMVLGQTNFSRFLRRWLVPEAVGIPTLRGRAVKTLAGLDHPLESI